MDVVVLNGRVGPGSHMLQWRHGNTPNARNGSMMTVRTPVDERLHATWRRMCDVCMDPRHGDYAAHGGMGVGVCGAWQHEADAFIAWAHAHGYADDRFLIRIRIAGDFAPENCWWVDAAVHGRYLKFIRLVAGEGTVRPVGEWLADPRCRVDLRTFLALLDKGWTVDRILSKPPEVRRRGRKYPFASADIPLGMVFGRLTVTGSPDTVVPPSGWTQYVYPCRCACGTADHRVYATNLLNGEIVSCGCYRRERRGTQTLTHGDTGHAGRTQLYALWTRMVAVCTKPPHRDYPIYGARGIAVCLAWQTDYVAFRTWALAQGYRDGLRVERRDRQGDFTPENCVLTDDAPLTSRSRILTLDGESKTLADWACDPRCIVSAQAFYQRMARGWTLEDALYVAQLRSGTSALIVAFGESRTLTEWSRDPRCLVPWTCVQGRLRAGWDAEAALTTPWGDSRPRIEAYGERKGMAAWMRDPRCVVPEQVLRKRLQQGWPAEQAIATPHATRTHHQPFEAFGEWKTLLQWARDARYGMPLTTLRSRLKAGWPLESALTTPATRLLEAFGESQSLAQWARDARCCVPLPTLHSRLKAEWPLESALTTPAGKRTRPSAT
jgi:hypothetical protein